MYEKAHIALKYAPAVSFTSPCQKCHFSLCPCHETPQHPKIHTKLAGYGQQKTSLPGADPQALVLWERETPPYPISFFLPTFS